MSNYRKIWEAYEKYAKTLSVIRRGHQIIDGFDKGLYAHDGTPEELFKIRGESVAEHQAKAAFLMRTCLESDYDSCLIPDLSDPERAKYELVTYMLIHDTGTIVTGDVLKDGSEHKNPPKIARDDKITFEDFVDDAFTFNGTQQRFKSWHRDTADKESGSYMNYTIAVVLSAIGQLETVLTFAYLEKHNIIGDITRKTDLSTDLQRAIEITGTNNLLDNFAAYMKMQIGKKLEFKQKWVIWGILQAAVEDVRGEFFPWWDKISDEK